MWMNEFLKSITTPAWWVSVVLVGVILNLAAAYLKPFLDYLGSRLSASVRREVEAERARFNWEVQKLVNNPVEATNLKLDLLYFSTRSVFWVAVLLASFLVQFWSGQVFLLVQLITPRGFPIAKYFAAFILATQALSVIKIFSYTWKGGQARDLLDAAKKRAAHASQVAKDEVARG